jgi:hypothetical protein
MMIVNDNSRDINKLEASLTDDARVVIYNRHMFIVQATDAYMSLNGCFTRESDFALGQCILTERKIILFL